MSWKISCPMLFSYLHDNNVYEQHYVASFTQYSILLNGTVTIEQVYRSCGISNPGRCSKVYKPAAERIVCMLLYTYSYFVTVHNPTRSVQDMQTFGLLAIT